MRVYPVAPATWKLHPYLRRAVQAAGIQDVHSNPRAQGLPGPSSTCKHLVSLCCPIQCSSSPHYSLLRGSYREDRLFSGVPVKGRRATGHKF